MRRTPVLALALLLPLALAAAPPPDVPIFVESTAFRRQQAPLLRHALSDTAPALFLPNPILAQPLSALSRLSAKKCRRKLRRLLKKLKDALKAADQKDNALSKQNAKLERLNARAAVLTDRIARHQRKTDAADAVVQVARQTLGDANAGLTIATHAADRQRAIAARLLGQLNRLKTLLGQSNAAVALQRLTYGTARSRQDSARAAFLARRSRANRRAFINALRATIRARRVLRKLERRVRVLSARVKFAEVKSGAQKRRLDQAELVENAARATVKEVEKAVKEAEKAAKEAREKLEAAEKTLKEVEEVIKELEKTIAELEMELEKCKEDARKAQEEYDESVSICNGPPTSTAPLPRN